MPGATAAGNGAATVTAGAGVLGLGANGITRLLLGFDMASDVELLPADSFTPYGTHGASPSSASMR